MGWRVGPEEMVTPSLGAGYGMSVQAGNATGQRDKLRIGRRTCSLARVHGHNELRRAVRLPNRPVATFRQPALRGESAVHEWTMNVTFSLPLFEPLPYSLYTSALQEPSLPIRPNKEGLCGVTSSRKQLYP